MSLHLRRPSLAALAVLAAILLSDQVTKALVLAAADRLPATVVGGVRLEIVHNTGISFSLFTGRGWLVTLLVGVVVLVVLALFLTLPRRYSIPLALLLGGSLSNLVDRLRMGYVVDFVAIYWWPRFNIADIAIIVGAALTVLMVLLHPGMRSPGTPADAGDGASAMSTSPGLPVGQTAPPGDESQRSDGAATTSAEGEHSGGSGPSSP